MSALFIYQAGNCVMPDEGMADSGARMLPIHYQAGNCVMPDEGMADSGARMLPIHYQAGNCVMPDEGIFAEMLSGWNIKRGDKIELIES